MAESQTISLVDSRHPGYLSGMTDWDKWRRTYEGGDDFRDSYLERFSTREDQADFATRKAITPVPKFAKAAINDIRNAIYQRLRDVVRKGGSEVYQEAVNGNNLGVDHRGSTMNAFLGVKVLTELLVMGRVGVFVDHPLVPADATLADVRRPARTSTSTTSKTSFPGPARSLKPRPSSRQSCSATRRCSTTSRRSCRRSRSQRYRYLRIDPDTGKVHLQFYNLDKEPVDQYGQPGGEIQLELDRIPFVMLDIGGSLIKDVCQQQIALLNLGSSDVNYALRSNFPFYIEQKDLRAVGAHLKHAATADGTATSGGQGAADDGHQGRRDARPGLRQGDESAGLHQSFGRAAAGEPGIAGPARSGTSASWSTWPCRAWRCGPRPSRRRWTTRALKPACRTSACCWKAPSGRSPSSGPPTKSGTSSKREVATIKYPDRYSLKSDADRIKEAQDLQKLMGAVPGRKVKRELAKGIVQALLGRQDQRGRPERDQPRDRHRPLHQQRPADDHPGGAGRAGRREDGFRGPGLRRRRVPGGPQGPRGAA